MPTVHFLSWVHYPNSLLAKVNLSITLLPFTGLNCASTASSYEGDFASPTAGGLAAESYVSICFLDYS